MKKLSTLFLMALFSYAEQPALPIEFFQMTTAVTIMPTILPTYVTVQHLNPPPGVRRRQKIEKFMNENFDVLKEEIAQGEGEYLDTLALLYEVEDATLWKKHLQRDFSEIYEKSRSKEEIVDYIDTMTIRKFKASKIYSVEEYNEITKGKSLDNGNKKE